MTTQQHLTFAVLLQSWNQHQDLRTANAPIATLAASRASLDEARLAATQQLRRAA